MALLALSAMKLLSHALVYWGEQRLACLAGVPRGLFELEDDEFEALLVDMEAALLEAAMRDEADALAAAEAADLAGLVEDFQQAQLESSRVPCPGAHDYNSRMYRSCMHRASVRHARPMFIRVLCLGPRITYPTLFYVKPSRV